MMIEKRERELALARRQQELEMKLELEAMQAETEIANMRDERLLKMQEAQLQLEEAGGSIRGSSISASLISLSIKEDKNSDIKSWLEQSSDVMDSQVEISRKVAASAKPKASSQERATLPTSKGLSNIGGTTRKRSPQRKSLILPAPRERTLSCSKSRTASPDKKPFASAPRAPPTIFNSSSVPQMPYPQWSPPATSLPKLKMSEFAGDPSVRGVVFFQCCDSQCAN